MADSSEVYRIVEDPAGVWASRPYRTIGAARAQASRMNNEETRWGFAGSRTPRKYKVQKSVTVWEDVE